MKLSDIEKYLQQKLSQKIAQPGKFPEPVKDYLVDFLKSVGANLTAITPAEDFIRLAFFMLKHNLTKIDKCGFEGCTNFKIFNKGWDGWNLRNGC